MDLIIKDGTIQVALASAIGFQTSFKHNNKIIPNE